jgi:hypothetical protein
MLNRAGASARVVFAAAALLTAAYALAQTPAAPAPTPAFSGGTVFDVKGDVSIMHGARTAPATRGTAVEPGDRVFVQPDAVLLIRCPEQDAQRITTAGSFTFSGCRPAAVAAVQPPTAPAAAPTPAATSSSSSLPTATRVATRSGMSGTTLGIIGGVLLLGAAAGGGGGGGGGSSGSTSPPASPP